MLDRINEAAKNYTPLLMVGIATLNLFMLLAAMLLVAVVTTRPSSATGLLATEAKPLPVRIILKPKSRIPVYVTGGSVGVEGVVTLNEPVTVQGRVDADVIGTVPVEFPDVQDVAIVEWATKDTVLARIKEEVPVRVTNQVPVSIVPC